MPSLDINLVLAVASLLLFLGFIALFAFLIRHQEQIEPKEPEVYGVELLRQHYGPGETLEQPTPYWVSPIPASPDPLEIAGNLDKKILISGAMIFAVLTMVGGYFVIQGEASPLRAGGIRAAAIEHQLRLDVRRGKELYASLCYDCHGRDGKGGTNPEGKQLPGFPLNVAGNKYENLKEDPAALAQRRSLLETTIERGRERPAPQYSMPAWHRDEGGQLSDWQVKQLVDFIMYGTEDDWADLAHIREHHGAPVAEQIPAPPEVASGLEVARGSCASCHGIAKGTPSLMPGAPNLQDWKDAGARPRPENQPLVALYESGDPDWLLKWVSNARKIKPDTIMTPQAASEGGPVPDENIKRVVDWLLGKGP